MRLIYMALLLGIIVVFYLSWTSEIYLDHLWFMPRWIGRWTNKKANGDLRTAVPFVFLGLFAGVLPTRNPFSLLRWLLLWGGLVVVVILAEAGQLFVPKRFFSWTDIGWGAVGAFSGLVTAFFIVYFRKRV